MIRTSCSRAEPAWLATISPSMASELARTTMMELCGSESKMSGVTMKTPISLGSRPDTRVSSRHTSRAIDAPAPPAIDDTTSTRGGSFGSNFPMPGTSAVDISEIVSTRNSASHAGRDRDGHLLRVARRPGGHGVQCRLGAQALRQRPVKDRVAAALRSAPDVGAALRGDVGQSLGAGLGCAGHIDLNELPTRQ